MTQTLNHVSTLTASKVLLSNTQSSRQAVTGFTSSLPVNRLDTSFNIRLVQNQSSYLFVYLLYLQKRHSTFIHHTDNTDNFVLTYLVSFSFHLADNILLFSYVTFATIHAVYNNSLHERHLLSW